MCQRIQSSSAVILHASDQMPRNGDQFFPYRQQSDFFYLTGIRQEKSILLLCPDHPDPGLRELLFVLPYRAETELWEGKKLSMEEASELSGIGSVFPLESFASKLREVLLRSEVLYVNTYEYPKYSPELVSRDMRFFEQLRKDYPLHRTERLAPILSGLRMIKEPQELDWIRKACAITAESFLEILPLVRPGMFEYEVEAELTRGFIRRGADGHSFQPIIAAGANACSLHYTSNRSRCREGDLLLIDFGAEYMLYAADCTRTIPVGGHFSDRQRKLYESVRKVYLEAVKLLVPGKSLDAFNKEVNQLWEEEHQRLGLYTAAELKAQDPKKPLRMNYYPHGTSHFIGLDVHDVGDKYAPLEPGMVLTCEPGIYLAGEGTGIRLENDLLITEKGAENLLGDLPMLPGEIEQLMQK